MKAERRGRLTAANIKRDTLLNVHSVVNDLRVVHGHQGVRNRNDTEVVHYGQIVPTYVCSPSDKAVVFLKNKNLVRFAHLDKSGE